MNKTGVCAVAIAAILIAQDALCASRAESTDEVKARLAQLASRASGGAGVATKPGKGRFAIVSRQKIIDGKAVDSIAASLGGQLKFPIESLVAGDGVFAVAKTADAMRERGLTVAIFLIEDAAMPMSLVAMEERWAAINVAKIADAGTDEAAKAQRLHKEVSRVAKALFSAVNTNKGAQAATDGKDLELMTADPIDANTLVTIARGLPSYGLVAPRTVPYHRAVKEGWAPEPTNEVQRAIWEKVRADKERGPSNPILIKPESKR